MSRLSKLIRKYFSTPPNVAGAMHMHREAERMFRFYMDPLPRGGVFVDLGANFGRVTERALEYCNTSYAFEPDPAALAMLRTRYQGDPRVVIVPKAIGGSARTTRFFREPGGNSEASSLIEYFAHHRGEAVEVEVVDIVAFLRSLEGPITAVKMDIEGAEAECLEALIEAGLYKQIGVILVETHEHISPDVARRLTAIRLRVQQDTILNIVLDFV